MFKILCSNCGAQSNLALKARGLTKETEIRLEGPVQLHIDNEWNISLIECETCQSQLTKPEGI